MRKTEKPNGMPSLHAEKVTDEPKASAPAAASAPATKTPGSGPVDSEVAAPRRRAFTAEFKRQVLAEADACSEPGEVGALLRRHGLYSSHLTEWRRQRDEGAFSGLAPKKRGRRANAKNPLAEENAKLQRELAKATARAERAERLLELQKNHPEGRSRLWDEKLVVVEASPPGRSGRTLFGDDGDPVKKHGSGAAAYLEVVTPSGDPV
jgi:transposase